jgi:hypothetical protein
MSEAQESRPYLHRLSDATWHLSLTILVAALAILACAAVGGFWWLFFWGIGHLFGAW